MNPLLLLGLGFLLTRARSGAPGWPPPAHPPPLIITRHGVTPLKAVDASQHMPTAEPAPTSSPAQQAAQALFDYLSGPTPDWGFPGRPSAHVKAAQAAMGNLTADGVYGAKTRLRCQELLGHPCPGRPGAASAAKSAALSKGKSLTSHLIPRIP